MGPDLSKIKYAALPACEAVLRQRMEDEMGIPDFTENEQKRVSTVLFGRYGKFIPTQLADSELQIGIDPGVLTLFPTLYWNERGAHFIVCKVGEGRYRCQFFYSESEQYGTGHEEYDELEVCVVTLLQVQSDHERQMANVSSGATAASLRSVQGETAVCL